MDDVRNPFAPGAGSRPPELAGRDDILRQAEIAVQRVARGRPTQPMVLLGLRGVGKTVLLNACEEKAMQAGHLTSFIEAPEGRPLAELLYPKMIQTLRRLSATDGARAAVHAALRALKGFASGLKISVGDFSVAVDAEPGVADSGMLDADLTDVFLRLGAAAQAAGRGWTLLIDEIQYLTETELAALIVALHRVSQKGLPIQFFGAGLPQLAALAGEAKSYAERLFRFVPIDRLDGPAAARAITVPIRDEGEDITPEAVAAILADTQGYPFFIQEWGFQAWNVAAASPITAADAVAAAPVALARLDESFFKVRFDRLTPKERDYVLAMARLGQGPYRSGDVAEALGVPYKSLGPVRASVIAKGMIYSPGHGDIAFTVPLFEAFLGRHYL